MFPILFTSVGRRVELMRHFRRALDQLGLEGPLVATDMDPLAPALQVVDRPVIVPRLTSPDYIPALLDICSRESIRLVLPLIDPDIPRLAAHRDEFRQCGVILGALSPHAAEICSDKWLTFQFFRQIGLATPRTWLPTSLDPNELEYPVFIKPRDGSASENTFIVGDAEELRVFCRRVPNAVLQEYLVGDGITADVLCDFASDRTVAVVCRKRIAVRGGEALKSVTVHDARIQEACCEIARHLPAIGPITVQCIVQDDTPYFIEINGRFGGGLPLAIAAGADLAAMTLSLAASLPSADGGLMPYEAGMYMTRCDESFFLTEPDCARLARDSVRLG